MTLALRAVGVVIVNSPRALEMGAALDAVVGDAIRQFDSSAQ